VTESLIANGADVNILDTSAGWSPLHFACFGSSIELVELLLKQESVDVLLKEKDTGNTPLHFIAKSFNNIDPAIIKKFIDKGCEVNVQNVDGETPLHRAASKGNEVMIRTLIKAGGDIDITNNDGETPLNRATRFGHSEAISVLLREYSIRRTLSNLVNSSSEVVKSQTINQDSNDDEELISFSSEPPIETTEKKRSTILFFYNKLRRFYRNLSSYLVWSESYLKSCRS